MLKSKNPASNHYVRHQILPSRSRPVFLQVQLLLPEELEGPDDDSHQVIYTAVQARRIFKKTP